MFPIVNTIPGFVSIKAETLSKFIMVIRRMVQMFKSKPTLTKSIIGNSDVFIVSFEIISLLVQVFLLLALNR